MREPLALPPLKTERSEVEGVDAADQRIRLVVRDETIDRPQAGDQGLVEEVKQRLTHPS